MMRMDKKIETEDARPESDIHINTLLWIIAHENGRYFHAWLMRTLVEKH